MSNSRNLADLDIGVGGLLPASNMATGAAVSNIGYTPVNNAGGTMTGALTATGFTGPLTGNAATATTATNQSSGTVSATSIAYSTTLTGGTGVVNLGAGQVYKDASGNVGVGTTTPSSFGKIAVIGGSAGTATSSLAISTANTAQGLRADLALYSTFVGTADNDSRRTADIVAGFNAGNWGTEYLTFNVGNNGTANDAKALTSEKMRIDSSGNLGLGVTPAAWDAVNKAFQVSSGSMAAATASVSFSQNAYYNAGWKYIATSTATQYDQFAGQHRWFNAPSGTAGNAITFTPAMMLDASGNLGIGTSLPVDLITVNRTSGSGVTSGISLTTAAGAVGDGSYIKWTGAGAGEKVARIDGVQEGSDTGSIRFNTGNGADGFTERMRIDSNGKVAALGSDGAGFTGITSVNSNSSVGIAGVQFGSDPTYVKAAIGLVRGFANGVGSLVFYNDSNTDAANWSTTDEKMRIDSSGNVGIGTSSPITYGKLGLSVSATASAITKVIGFQNSAGVDNASLRIAGYNYADNVQTAIDFIQNSSSNFQSQIAFSTNGGGGLAERARIDSSGNFSITQTPGKYTVDVTGGATGIANGGTVNFPTSSGMLIVNNFTQGSITIYLCGGGGVNTVSSVGGQVGLVAHNASINGYTFTSNYGSTAVFGFFFVRTRPAA